MRVQSAARVLLVAFAAVLVGRITHSLALAPVAVTLALVGWSLEAAWLARFRRACQPVSFADQPDTTDLASAVSARSLPWLVASLVVLTGAVTIVRPAWLAPEVPFVLLVLCHGTAFRVVQHLTWPLAAGEVTQAWRRAISPRDLGALHGVRQVVLLKRGVLTAGPVAVDHVASFSDDLKPEDVLRLCAALLRNEDSDVSDAVTAAARRARLALPNVSESGTVAHLARSGRINGAMHYLGGGRLAEHLGSPLPELAEEAAQRHAQGGTVLVLCTDEAPLGMVGLRDPWRARVDLLAEGLRQAGARRVGLLSDDDPDAAAANQVQLGVNTVVSQLARSDVDETLSSWVVRGPVAMVVPAGHGGSVQAQAVVVLGRAAGGLSLPVGRLEHLPAAWRAVRGTGLRERQLNRRLLLGYLLALLATLVAAPLWLVLLADELMVLGTLRWLIARLPYAAGELDDLLSDEPDEAPVDEPTEADDRPAPPPPEVASGAAEADAEPDAEAAEPTEVDDGSDVAVPADRQADPEPPAEPDLAG